MRCVLPAALGEKTNMAANERADALNASNRITATVGEEQQGGAESLRVSALKYLNHAPVTLLPHVDVSVYQNEG